MINHELEDLESLIGSYSNIDLNGLTRYIAAQTGIISLDLQLGGGFAPGLIEVYGKPSVGKTALAGQVIAHNQRRKDFAVALLPSEYVDTAYLRNLGVDLASLPVLKLDEVELFFQAFNKALVVIDSITSLISSDDNNAALFDLLEQFKSYMAPEHCILAISHVRNNTSVDPRKTFVAGTRSASRRMSDFFDVRLELDRKDVSPPNYTQLINIVANINAPPGRFVELKSRMGYGVDRFADLLYAAWHFGVMEKKGNYYYFYEERFGPGEQNSIVKLKDRKDLELAIIKELLT